jgi:hypothetical protein
VDVRGDGAYREAMRAAILLVLCLPALAVAQSTIARSEVTALKRQGYVFYEGRWRLPREIVYLQTAASRFFAASAPAAPAPAKAVADVPQRVAPRDRLQQRRRSTVTGLFTVRLQHVQLLGLDTVPVGFGTGQARLQLPRTQSISIGTTVGMPLR